MAKKKRSAASTAKKTTKKKTTKRGASSRKRRATPDPTPSRDGAVEDLVAALQGTAPRSSLTDDPTKKSRGEQRYDIFSLVERKLRAKVRDQGKTRIAAHVVAERYVDHLLEGHYKFVKDFLDRVYGRPTQRVEVGRSAIDELRDFLTRPLEQSRANDISTDDLAELRKLARGLRSEKGKQLRAAIERIADSK